MFPQLFGKYVLEREIAEGGMARVYLATLRGAVGFEKRLVVKQIRPELASDEAFVKRFVEEAKTAVELSHANIVPVYELGVEQGIYYIAMEHFEGATLAEVLAETGALTPEEGAYVGIEISRALDYAHRRAGVVHRDVTPRNVLLDEEGAVRLIDFGIAAPVSADGLLRPAGEIFGSPGHMPPEQMQGGALTPATDVFAVAVLLYEAWTEQPPFRRATAAASRDALEEQPRPLCELRPELAPISDLIAAAVALDPEDRPQSAEALARPLRDFVKSVDLGDMARRLGERVRKVRPEEPPLDPTPVATTPLGRSPSIGDTQTFAARDDLVEWTRRLESEPPPSEQVMASPPAARPKRRALGWLGLPALVIAAGLGWWGMKGSTDVPAHGAMRHFPPFVAPLPSPPPPAPPALAPVASSSSPQKGRELTPTGEKATVSLTASPPSLVNVGGRPYGTTPVMGLQLPPGSYPVSFENPALGLRTAARITLAAGSRRSVHADFASATPSVIVR